MEKIDHSMEINEIQIGSVIVLRAKGKLDANLSKILEKKAVEYISQGQIKLLLNLNDISYVNSAGLRMLLSIKKQVKSLGGKLVVCGLSTEVMEIMKICGFDHVLEISNNEEEALRQF